MINLIVLSDDNHLSNNSGNHKSSSSKSNQETPSKSVSKQLKTAFHSNNYSPKTRKRTQKVVRKTPVRIIPLGGLNEIGKNMTLYECGQDMFLIDCGLAFPDADMLGVDLVIPDFSYVEKNIDKIRGIFITHGHEDHIGSIPYLLK